MKKILVIALVLLSFKAGQALGTHHALMDCEVEKYPYLVSITLDGETYYHATSTR